MSFYYFQKLFVCLCVCGFSSTLWAENVDSAAETPPAEKVKKITFIEDDAQMLIVSKMFELKHVRSADIAPFVRSAVTRFVPASTVSALHCPQHHIECIIVSTPQDMMPFVDEMLEKLDRPCGGVASQNAITGTGVTYGQYTPKFRASKDLGRLIKTVGISSGPNESFIGFDPQTSTFYFKDCASRVREIHEKLSWLDQPVPQARVTFNIYELSEREIKDVGLDYLAWKNGPGLNLFEAGYEAVGIYATERAFQEAVQTAIDLVGNFSYSFGGMYTAPAFDFSFIRLLQQNNLAKINSTATLWVTNAPNREFTIKFSPEYQSIVKGEDFQTGVDVGGNSDLSLTLSEVMLIHDREEQSSPGIISLHCLIDGEGSVARNNYGAELSEKTTVESHLTANLNHEKLIAVWNKKSKVKQRIGVPFLSELPILEYIFGTVTEHEDRIVYFVTMRAEGVSESQHDAPQLSKR